MTTTTTTYSTAPSGGYGPASLVWLDLETTGLAVRHDPILEVACVVTDAELRVRRTFSVVLAHRRASFILEPLSEEGNGVALDMHLGNGLAPTALRAARRRERGEPLAQGTIDAEALDGRLAGFLAEADAAGCPLAGSSVHFDRSMLETWAPRALGRLHYRNVDVSTVRELAKRWAPRAYKAEPQAQGHHRALADVRDSITLARHYRNAMGWTEERNR